MNLTNYHFATTRMLAPTKLRSFSRHCI